MSPFEASRGVVSVDRRTLYEQVWSVPGSALAARYGISDVGLAKACRRHNIPRPPRGYWAKLRAGKPARRTPLPKSASPREEVVQMQGWDRPDETLVSELARDARRPPMTPTRHARPDGSPPHPLVEAAKAQLGAAKPDPDGLLATDPATAPTVRVAPPSVDRALAVLDLFAKRWTEKGGLVRPGAAGPATAVGIGGDEFTFELGEVLDDKLPVTDPARRTGRLYVHIGGDEQRQFRRRWHDTKSQPLERLLGQLVETLAGQCAARWAERLDAECVERQERRAAVVRKAAADRQTREFYWRQHLHRDVDLWHEAERVRAFLAARAKAVGSGQFVPVDQAAEARWAAWAARYADAIDPLVGARHPEDAPPAPTNTPAVNLDVTSRLRPVVERLAVPDTDALARVPEATAKEACGGAKFGLVWNEITRLLQGLDYDVVGRRAVSFWE